MEKSFCLIFLFVFTNVITVESCYETSPKPTVVCKNLTISNNLPIEEVRYNILRHLWDRPLTSWSPDAKLLRTLIIPLLKTTDTNHLIFARYFTILMTLFQRRYEFQESTSACVIGNFINAMASCQQNKDPELLQHTNLEEFYYYTANYFYGDGITFAGCANDIDLMLPDWHCEDDGLVYEIDFILNNTYYLPLEIKKVVRKLYDSETHADRYLAALAIFSITNDAILTSKLDELEYLELIDMYRSRMTPPECCPALENRLGYLVNKYYRGALARIDFNQRRYRQPDACK